MNVWKQKFDLMDLFARYLKLCNQSGTPKGNLGFQSKYKDPESGLYYYYHRYYNPHNGRFLNEDPIGLNQYNINYLTFYLFYKGIKYGKNLKKKIGWKMEEKYFIIFMILLPIFLRF